MAHPAADLIVDDGDGKATIVDFKLTISGVATTTAQLRAYRQLIAELSPWLGEVAWPFPAWSPTWRPFDWATDEADVPVGPITPTPFPEQARLRLYLHPSAAVVQR